MKKKNDFKRESFSRKNYDKRNSQIEVRKAEKLDQNHFNNFHGLS